MDFVRSHAQEMDDDVMRSHIALFVNDYSVSLGAEGRKAVSEFTGLGDNIFVNG
jgi:1,4-dihydroxy-6-naphthoate synthase